MRSVNWDRALQVAPCARALCPVGIEFVYRYKDLHYSKHRLTDVVPNKSIVWLTTDSNLNFAGSRTEWTGTTVTFNIIERDGQTDVEFNHVGLLPELACYNNCTGSWGHYLKSLQKLITTGTGDPDPLTL